MASGDEPQLGGQESGSAPSLSGAHDALLLQQLRDRGTDFWRDVFRGMKLGNVLAVVMLDDKYQDRDRYEIALKDGTRETVELSYYHLQLPDFAAGLLAGYSETLEILFVLPLHILR